MHLNQSNDRIVNYRPAGPVARSFMQSNAFVRAIMGPLGSGKSVACTIEILRRAKMQEKASDGRRYTRWAVIRNSYPELKSTTLKTWSEWAPGKVTGDTPYTYRLDTDELSMEVFFLALDHPDDAKKILSLEITGAWVNEFREIPKLIIDQLTGRVGRYPSKMKGGCTWSGIIMDTNPFDNQHWGYRLFEEGPIPEGWEFFKQPSGLGPDAENAENLPQNYYKRLTAGKDEDWIRIYCGGEFGFLNEGQAVFPMFRDRIHTACENIEPVPGIALQVSADFGLTPAALIGQRLPDGRWIIIDELVTDDCGITRFAELLSAYLNENYPDHQVAVGWGDPAGNVRSQSDERTALEIMNQFSPYKWKPAPSNDITMRLEVVKTSLNRLVDGNPGLLVSPRCKMLRKGFSGGYHYKLLRSGDGTQTHETPNKNSFSHVHDSLQYLLLGGGEHDVVLNKIRRSERIKNGPKIAKGLDYQIFGRR